MNFTNAGRILTVLVVICVFLGIIMTVQMFRATDRFVEGCSKNDGIVLKGATNTFCIDKSVVKGVRYDSSN